MATNKLNAIQREIVTLLRDLDTPQEGDRVARLRQVASRLLDAREHFRLRNGDADLLGRSLAYRQWAQELYSEAGITGEAIPRIQANVRYHTGNILRERLSPDEIAALGLKEHSPRERAISSREERSDVLRIVTGAHMLTDAEDILEALSLARGMFYRISPEAMDALSAAARRRADAEVERIIELVRRINVTK